MNTTIETIPAAWDDQRDGQFFRVTASLFPQSFCLGASVLLATYDTDDLSQYDVIDADLTSAVSVAPTTTSETSVTTDVTPYAA